MQSHLLWLLLGLLTVGSARRHRRNDIEISTNQCYSRGRAQKCVPPFDNVAANKPVHATSTCGNPPSRVCSTVESEGRPTTACARCDSSRPDKWHPAAFLTDRENPNNKTCWISGPVGPQGDTTVNLTVSFGKRFEVLYIYLVPCGHMPDSIVYYKSADFGKTWQPWRYFSKDCFRAFGMATMDNRFSYSSPKAHTAMCEQLKPLSAYTGVSAERIVFSTTTGQAGDDNPTLIDWRTATDLKVSMSRFQGAAIAGRSGRGSYFLNNFAPNDEPQASHYAFSQLSVGGRCKCNGHSNRCEYADGRLRCMCAHNTEGDDCEQCKTFFLDQPWARATEENAHVCKACNCNNHSTKCKFSQSAYTLSQHTTGSACFECQHNTIGRQCERCAEGYHRDPNRSLRDRHVCQVCNCHPLGSEDVRSCDAATGQCRCKPGVTGKMCNRCKEGYQQSNDLLQPCRPVQNAFGDDAASPKCGKCRSNTRRIRFKKFCRRDYAIHIDVRARQTIGSYVRFQVDVQAVFRRSGRSQMFLPPRRSSSPLVIWVPRSNLACSCPDLRMGRAYLLLSDANTFEYKGQASLILNHKSTLLPWLASMRRRMIKFRRKEKRGRCPSGNGGRQGRKSRRNRRRRGRQRQSQNPTYYQSVVYQGDDGSRPAVSAPQPRHRIPDNNYGYYGTS